MEEKNDSYTKIEKWRKRYSESEKGKENQRRYLSSPLGKQAKEKYIQSEKGQIAQLRYYLSEKGIETRQRSNELKKLMRRLSKYLEQNPSKTISDFLESINLDEKPDIPAYCLICHRLNGEHDEGCSNG